MEGLDSGGQGPTSGCCAIEEEEEEVTETLKILSSPLLGITLLLYSSRFVRLV
jgi:hypothetical protein